jgi:hypothetical protein
VFGPFGEVAWIGLCESLSQLDVSDDQQMAVQTYIDMVNGAGEPFSTGTVSSDLLLRVN